MTTSDWLVWTVPKLVVAETCVVNASVWLRASSGIAKFLIRLFLIRLFLIKLFPGRSPETKRCQRCPLCRTVKIKSRVESASAFYGLAWIRVRFVFDLGSDDLGAHMIQMIQVQIIQIIQAQIIQDPDQFQPVALNSVFLSERAARIGTSNQAASPAN